MKRWGWALALVVAFAPAAWGQQDDKEALKKKILAEVEKRLNAERDRLLADIEKIIDEELKKSGQKPAKVEPPKPVDPPKPPPPKPVDPPKPKARGYLGIRPGELTQDELDALKIKGGVKVFELVEGAPAEAAGLKADDVIVAIDGEAVTEPMQLPTIIQRKGAGTTITVKVIRDGKEQEIKVKLGKHPDDPGEPEPEPPKPEPKAKPVEPPKPEAPGRTEEELRERIKKFLDKEKKDPPKKDDKPAAEPKKEDEELFTYTEEEYQKLKSQFESFGVNPEKFFDKGADGKYRLLGQYRDMLKGFGVERIKELLGRKGAPAEPKPEPKPAPKPEPKPEPRPWLGIEGEDLSDEARAKLDIEEGVGFVLTGVREGSPAAKAGLQKGDIVVKLNGRLLKGEEGLAKFMAAAKPGQAVEISYLRGGKETTVKATMGTRP